MSALTATRAFWFFLFVAVAGIAAISTTLTPLFWGLSIGLGATLAVLSWIDIGTYKLPNILTLPLLAAGLVQAWLFDIVPVMDSLLGALIGYGVFWLIGTMYFKARGFEGLGLGDAKLLAAGGAWTGALALSPIVLISCLLAIPLALINRDDAGRGKVAFGPWLAIGIWAAWMLGYGSGQIPVSLVR